MTDDKKVGGKLTEEQLSMGVEALEKRSVVERAAPRKKKTRQPVKETAARLLQKVTPEQAEETPAKPAAKKNASRAEKPAKKSQISRFMNYYLPTTLKLLNAYDRMDQAGVEGANIDGTMGKIGAMLDQICTAFDRQLDALFAHEALDISTDITVLEQMLAREGLGGVQLGQDE